MDDTVPSMDNFTLTDVIIVSVIMLFIIANIILDT
jgi:hypothetical protein